MIEAIWIVALVQIVAKVWFEAQTFAHRLDGKGDLVPLGGKIVVIRLVHVPKILVGCPKSENILARKWPACAHAEFVAIVKELYVIVFRGTPEVVSRYVSR